MPITTSQFEWKKKLSTASKNRYSISEARFIYHNVPFLAIEWSRKVRRAHIEYIIVLVDRGEARNFDHIVESAFKENFTVFGESASKVVFLPILGRNVILIDLHPKGMDFEIDLLLDKLIESEPSR